LNLELENLTRELFEEANQLVANEARLRAELQSSNQKLSREFQAALDSMRTSANDKKEKYRMVQRRQCMSQQTSSSSSSSFLSSTFSCASHHVRSLVAYSSQAPKWGRHTDQIHGIRTIKGKFAPHTV